MHNFGGIPEIFSSLENSAIVVLPVPYDGTSTWIKGADKGPDAIITASENMELYDIESDSEVYKMGIHTADPVTEASSPEKMTEAVYKKVKYFLGKNKFIVSIGGEHSVSAGIVKAFTGKFKKLTVVQLDAHSDMRQEYEGSKYNHACVMARIKELCPVIQLGIRSMDIAEKSEIKKKRVFWAHEIHDSNDWMKKFISKLSDNVYITIDLDVFDPSIMPSTGTPEPGGLGWYQVIDILRAVNRHSNIVGFDVVELCPDSNNRAPDFLASKLIYRLLSIIYHEK